MKLLNKQEKLRETQTNLIFNGNYILTIEFYETYCWGKIKDIHQQVIVSIQVNECFLWFFEIGTHYLIVNKNEALIDLNKKTYRKLDGSVESWQKVFLSPDERTLLVMGEHYIDRCAYSFYDLSGKEITKLRAPVLDIYLSCPYNDYEEDKITPSVCALSETLAEWRPDGRLIWTERRPYYTDLEMWNTDAEYYIDTLFPVPCDGTVNTKFHDAIKAQCERKEKEHRVWRVFETIILKRDNQRMIISK